MSYDYRKLTIPREKPMKVAPQKICEKCGREHNFRGKYCLDCKVERIRGL